jgi:hypothetical protein
MGAEQNATINMEQGGEVLFVGDGGTVDLNGQGSVTVSGTTVTLTIESGAALVLSGIPTADPTNAGEVYSDSGVLTLSGG